MWLDFQQISSVIVISSRGTKTTALHTNDTARNKDNHTQNGTNNCNQWNKGNNTPYFAIRRINNTIVLHLDRNFKLTDL